MTRAEGRRFGVTVGLAFLALALVFWWRGHDVPRAIAGLAALAFLLGGLLLPAYMGPVYRAWMRMGLALSRVTTPVFMSVIFFLVITPFGLVARAVGHRPLRPRGSDSFWRPRAEGDRKSDLRRQF